MRVTFVKAVASQGSFGGGSVHFGQLAQSLAGRGHSLAVFQNEPAKGGYRLFPRTRWGACRAACWSDVFYMRLTYYSKRPGRLPRSLEIMRRARRSVLAWEVNAPIEERIANGWDTASDVERKVALVRAAARSVDIAFSVSEEMVDYARQRLGLRNVHYVPNGANCSHFSPNTHPTGRIVRPDCPVILWVGSGHFPWEGDGMVIELAKRLKASGSACLIVMAGNRREGAGEYPENVLHLGRVPHDEVPSVVAAADICLCIYNLAAYGETGFYGSPIKLYEYMAAGKAVVATRVGEIERTIEDGVSGMLVSSEDELDAAVSRLLADGDLRARLGAAARRKAEGHYNWDRAARQIEEAILALRRSPAWQPA